VNVNKQQPILLVDTVKKKRNYSLYKCKYKPDTAVTGWNLILVCSNPAELIPTPFHILRAVKLNKTNYATYGEAITGIDKV
jgi:hypothetical protein